jgi:hypothetical protein
MSVMNLQNHWVYVSRLLYLLAKREKRRQKEYWLFFQYKWCVIYIDIKKFYFLLKRTCFLTLNHVLIKVIFCLVLPKFGILVQVSHNCIMDRLFRTNCNGCGHNDTSDDVCILSAPTNAQFYILYILLLIFSDIFGAIDILSNVQILN